MISVMKERKVGVIFATVVSVLNFIIFCASLVWFDGNYFGAGIVITIVLAVISYVLAGGLSVAIKALLTAFKLGFIIPIFPIDICIGIMLASFVLLPVWMFPIVGVLISCFIESR